MSDCPALSISWYFVLRDTHDRKLVSTDGHTEMSTEFRFKRENHTTQPFSSADSVCNYGVLINLGKLTNFGSCLLYALVVHRPGKHWNEISQWLQSKSPNVFGSEGSRSGASVRLAFARISVGTEQRPRCG